MSFKMKTPTVRDKDIKDLAQLYPKTLIENQKKEEEQNNELKAWQKKTLDKILKNIEKMEGQNKIEKEKIVYDMLVQNIKEDEFMRTVDKLKEIDFAESIIIQTLFEYKLKDEHDQIDLANEVAKEYHSGKLDPKLAMKIEKRKKLNFKNIRRLD